MADGHFSFLFFYRVRLNRQFLSRFTELELSWSGLIFLPGFYLLFRSIDFVGWGLLFLKYFFFS